MTAVLPDAADVVVIGGGVMGASTAFHLAEAGVSVVLLERGDLAGGSTSRAAGGVRANFSDALNIALGKRSLECFAAFDERPGQGIDLHRSGYLFVLQDESEVAAFEAAVALQSAMGVESRIVDVDEACRLSPYLDPEGVIAAAWSPGDGHCSPESVVLGYASGARRHGARILTHLGADAIEVRGGEITGVVTDRGTIATGTVVNCAGVWSPQVAAMVGEDLPVVPLRRQLLVTEALPEPVATAFTIEYGTTLYWHREGPGMLMGFSDRTVEPGFDLAPDPDFAEKLGALLERRAPALLDLGVTTGWTGLYETTPDHNALLGEFTTVSRMLYATGFSGHGFLQGPAVGEILRDLVLGAQPAIDVRALGADRFATGSLRPEHNIV